MVNFNFGSCQYNNIANIVSRNIKKVRTFNSKEEIITFLNDKIGLKVSGISDVVYKEFSSSVISNFIEWHTEVYGIQLEPNEVIELHKKGTLQNTQDAEFIDYFEALIKCKNIVEFSSFASNYTGSDLWSVSKLFGEVSGLQFIDDGNDSIVCAGNILFLVWKYKIPDESIEEAFRGFPT